VSTAAQTAADLRTLVLRRVGEGKRVVLLAPDASLGQALEAAGCTVLRDPASLDELQAFAPQVVVAFDGLIERGEGAETFVAISAAAPKAQLLFSFANCASASSLLGGLLGHPQPSGLSERDVRGWLGAAGLEVVSREVVVMPHVQTGLSADTEASLRQLLEQLNPDAGVDRVLLCAVKPARPDRASPHKVEAAARVKGLVSLLVLGDSDALSLDATLASALAQTVRPLEVVVALAREEASVARLLERAKEKEGLTVRTVIAGDVEPARLAQRAQELATGQYLALFRAGDVADKGYLARLLGVLSRSTAAWAHALATRGNIAGAELPTALARIAGARTSACGWLIDLDALGVFPVTFAEGIPAWETLLFARLSALFPPILLGASGVERGRVPPEPLDGWAAALETRPLRWLSTLDQQLALAKVPDEPPAAEVVARALGKTLEERAPQLFGRLKKAAKRII
jgi:hypothetical protein